MSNSSEKNSSDTGKPDVIGDQLTLLPEAIYKSNKAPSRPPIRIKAAPLQFKDTRSRSGDFEALEFDLIEIAKAKTTESYVMRSFMKHVTLMLKSGWTIDGRNPKTIDYVFSRLREASINSNTPFDNVLRAVVQNMVQYCNAFIIFVRDKSRSEGKIRRVFGKKLLPIAGVFSADPTSMYVKKTNTGDISKWKQRLPNTGDEKEFDKEDVVHLFYNREDGFVGGTPWIVPVLDDIRSWRRMEELAELIAQKHAFPLFHYIVGTETSPAKQYDDGTSEVDIIRSAVESMPTEGCLVTPERHQINVVGIEGKALDLKDYLKYWEERVIAGLGLSGIDLGKGDSANRATAQQLSKSLADLCTDIQGEVAKAIDFYVFDQLLEEGGHSLTEVNRVHLKFPVIDMEQMYSYEKHTEYLYTNNLITETEARQALNRPPITDEMREDMFYNRIEIPLAIIKAIDESYTESSSTQSAQASAAGTNKKIKAKVKTAMSKKANKSSNVNRPANQYGKLAAKTKPVRDKILNKWFECATNEGNEFIDYFAHMINPLVSDAIQNGISDFGKLCYADLFTGAKVKSYFFDNYLLPELTALTTEVTENAMNSNTTVRKAAIINSKSYAVNSLIDSLTVSCYSYGYRYAAKLFGYKAVDWVLSADACDRCRGLDLIRRPVRKPSFAELSSIHYDCFAGHSVRPTYLISSNEDKQKAFVDIVDPLVRNNWLKMDFEMYDELLLKLAELKDKLGPLGTIKEDLYCGSEKTFPIITTSHVKLATAVLPWYSGPDNIYGLRKKIDMKLKL